MNYQKLGTELAMAVTDAETLDEEEAAFKVLSAQPMPLIQAKLTT